MLDLGSVGLTPLRMLLGLLSVCVYDASDLSFTLDLRVIRGLRDLLGEGVVLTTLS